MPRLSPKPLKLEDDEQKELEKILARHSTSQQIAKRGQIILLAAQGKNHRQRATELGVSREMTRLWRERWLELKQEGVGIVERLKDAERPGAPTKREFEYIRHGTQTLIASFEIWFSILMRKLLKRSSFTSKGDLASKILDFIAYYNDKIAKPFKWTYKGKALTA
jgi:hypothetical protein